MASIQRTKLRPYRDFLTPAFHRQFTNASLLVIAFCWLEATLMSSGGLFWSWFPLSFTGIRTLLLFCSCLGIFIVRLSGLHFGERTTASGFETFSRLITSPNTIMALIWHAYSAFLFGEIFIWSKGQDANLGWVDHGKAYERPRLNENPVVLRSFYIVLAIMQTTLHLYRDKDKVTISIDVPGVAAPGEKTTSKLPLPLLKLSESASAILMNAVNLSLAALVSITPIYFLFIRRFAWSWAYYLGQALVPNLPSKAAPTGLVHLPGLVWQAATSAMMLVLLWEVSNEAFSIFVSEPPLKRGQPVTSEIKNSTGVVVSRSTDPNGSLITGLKSKKEGPHTYAFWELFLICSQFEGRRKTIFAEIDRASGSTWSQICQQCLGEVEAISARIGAYQTSIIANQNAVQRGQQDSQVVQSSQQAQGLPRIANQTVQPGDIVTRPSSGLSEGFGGLAKSFGQSPGAPNPLSPTAKRALKWSADHILTKQQQSQLSKQGISQETSGRALQILQTSLGEPFREPFERTVNAVIFGTPYSARVTVIHAARSLSLLLKASLTEDSCGVAAKDVPHIIRTYTSAINSIRRFVESLAPSWTDVEFHQKQRRVKEVDELLLELQNGLEGILLAFGEYASSLGISRKELREAKETIGGASGTSSKTVLR